MDLPISKCKYEKMIKGTIMIVAFPIESHKGEKRVSVLPQTVEKYLKLGIEVRIEKGLGQSLNLSDEQYKESGAVVVADRQKLISDADIVLRLGKPPVSELEWMKAGSIHISHLDPFNETDLIGNMSKQKVTAISMEMIPRITRAQKMDALSSQASLAGYAAVILAANRLDRILPMMMTPAGTITPAGVFVIGAGVAGLQAIATAKRLGAKVEAFDTRPVVEEQVQSLGAKFLKIDLGETGQTKDGYAKELTPEQIKKQQAAMAKRMIASDIVITTAKLFGRKSPIIITKEVIAKMRSGSVIIDLAAESGGNVEGLKIGQEYDQNGVHIVGLENLANEVPYHASQMYSSNLFNLVSEFWDKDSTSLNLDLKDDILKGCVITSDGSIVNERILNFLNK